MDERLIVFNMLGETRAIGKGCPSIGNCLDGEFRFEKKEWVEDPYFYDKLTDAEEREIAIFRLCKERMNVEFQAPSVTKKLTIVEDGQLLYPDCSRAQESLSQEGMIVCPSCSAFLHNPLFKAAERKGTVKGKAYLSTSILICPTAEGHIAISDQNAFSGCTSNLDILQEVQISNDSKMM